MAHGEFNHIEIPYDAEERAKRFYAGVFDWEFRQAEGFDGHDLFTSGPGELGGALGTRGESAGTEIRSYILVDSIDDAAGKVTELGGSITTPRTEIPGQGWHEVGTDSEGNPLALYENLPG
jgi:predicted enzyme related to lactoylglutathione lyase